MGRKNRRRKEDYMTGFHFNPNKYITRRPPEGKAVARESRLEHFVYPKRFEVWFADLGQHHGTSVQAGYRPVIIMSCDRANRFSNTITVLPITSKYKRPDLPTHVWIEALSHEMTAGMVLAEQITTIAKVSLHHKIGMIGDEKVQSLLKEAVGIQLGVLEKRGDSRG